MDIREFLFWEGSSRDTIDFKKIYVDIAEDLISGLLLSQIIYWHLPSKETGKTKLRIFKDGQYWLAKERGDWYDEIRISVKQYDRAIKILERKGIVELQKFKFDGMPTIHIRLIWENFLFLMENLKKNEVNPYSPMGIPQTVIPELPKGEERNSPKGNTGIAERGILLTENTDIDYLSENTNKENKNLVNNKPLNIDGFTKKEMIKYANEFYPEFAPGRWSKEQWNFITIRLVTHLMNGEKYFAKASDPFSYLRGCYKDISTKHDIKVGKTKAKIEEVMSDNIPYYDWLNQ